MPRQPNYPPDVIQGDEDPREAVLHHVCERCGEDLGELEVVKDNLGDDLCKPCFEKEETCQNTGYSECRK